MKIAYKVLKNDMTSPFQTFRYEIGKEYRCNDFDEDEKRDCSKGLYATGIDGILYSFNIHRRVFRCEVGGKAVEIDQYKRRYEYLKLLNELSHEEVKRLAETEEEGVGFRLVEALFPINPLLMPKRNPTEKDIEDLRQWASVWDSVWDSVWASGGASVWASVRASVWGSVWDSVLASVWDSVLASVRASGGVSVRVSGGVSVRVSVRVSVWDSVLASVLAYISSLFPNIKKWKGIDHDDDINPFQPVIDLWRLGYIVSYDGQMWRLHAGENAEIVYEMRG